MTITNISQNIHFYAYILFSFDIAMRHPLGFHVWDTHRNHEHDTYDFHIFIEKFNELSSLLLQI